MSARSDCYRWLMSLVSDRTREQYSWHIKQIEKAGYKPARMSSRQWFDYLYSQKSWGINTGRQALSAAKSFQKFLHSEKKFRKEKYPLKKTPIPKAPKSNHANLSVQDRDKVLGSLDLSRIAHRQYRVMIALMWDALLRIGEVSRLEVQHIRFDEGKFTVLCKGMVWRAKPLTDRCAVLVQDWLEDRPHDSETLFQNIETGKPFTVDGLRANFRHLAKRAGVRANPHAYRHGGAHEWTRQGLPSFLLKLLGGWDNIETAQIYQEGLLIDDIRNFQNGVEKDKLRRGLSPSPLRRASP